MYKVVIANEENEFFETVNYIIKADEYRFDVLWKPKNIGGTDGFIVQKVIVNNSILGVGIETEPYFEAWEVIDGKTETNDYDDGFSCFYIENKGIIQYFTEVYWIDHTDELFQKVSRWEKNTVRMANDLPATYDFPEIKKKNPVFIRKFSYDNNNL